MAVAAQLYGSRECGRMVAGARRALQKVLQSREGRGLLSEWGIEGGVVNDMVQTLMDCEQAYADPDRMAMSSGEED